MKHGGARLGVELHLACGTAQAGQHAALDETEGRSQAIVIPEGDGGRVIGSHHGTSCTAYFLNKYLNEGGDPADVADFYYHGQKPVSKEQVILMLCDSIEAASRTLTEFTPEAFDRFVENIISGKEKDGQLEDADLTLHELNVIKKMLKTYLQQIYHGRVAYPKRKR